MAADRPWNSEADRLWEIDFRTDFPFISAKSFYRTPAISKFKLRRSKDAPSRIAPAATASALAMLMEQLIGRCSQQRQMTVASCKFVEMCIYNSSASLGIASSAIDRPPMSSFPPCSVGSCPFPCPHAIGRIAATDARKKKT
eukprot:647999-Pleurochrysis_carterae.AAC.3